MEPAAAAAEVGARRRAALAVWVVAAIGACAGSSASPVTDPRVLRQWSEPAPAGLAAPAAAVVGSAVEWAALAQSWRLPAATLPAAACDFTVARCLLVAAPAGRLHAEWGTEEGVDVLTLAAGPGPATPTVHAFALARRPAQLAVVYRPATGGERVLWVDSGR